ncbi:MAG: DegT/DnrJ/EryC1/StrS family aminotransferase [Thermoguttaceae bacterium]|jgi:dTDP-4-amino-4,6-dideoxygalactose transaminase|nr:DegT/DnrJ/EryC1/StrS family aminotransferase [Thermoguttaceae bacterium]
MDTHRFTRRQFVAATSLGSLAAVAGQAAPAHAASAGAASKLAVKGGTPVRTKGFGGWPIWDKEHDEELVLSVIRSGVWSRSKVVTEFEQKWAEMLGAKRCLATTNGTNALLMALNALDIGAGDEVLVGPYTFVASVSTILLSGALPIMVDTDRETFLVNPAKMEEKITPNTKAILPVHIYGLPADMDRINAIAKKHNLVVVEDACQAWLAEYRGKKCGTLGNLGCFSFQNSKHLTCGEGGAVVGNDDAVMDRAVAYHNFGRGTPYIGTKCRTTEFQAAILLVQMQRLEEQTQRRWENATYLTSKIKDIPGIAPHKLYDGVTRAAYHLYPLRFNPEEFGVARSRFLAALQAEGIPCGGGYGRLNKSPFIENTLSSRSFQRMYSKEQLDYCREQIECPDNDMLCNEAVCFSQRLFLGGKEDMDDIANAMTKIYENREQLT